MSELTNGVATGRERILDWDGVLNARDSGGLHAADGAIRRGALVRSGVLNDLTPAGVAALVAHGVRTVIDVRAPDEIAHAWERYPLREHPVVDYRNLSFTAGQPGPMDDQARAMYSQARTREEINKLDLDRHGPSIGAIVAAIADAPAGGVLIHCHAGKDRTGIVMALTLAAVGVSDAEIADDYALTQLVLDRLLTQWFDHIGVTDEAERERLSRLSNPRQEAMLETLRYLRERFGGAVAYLLANGVTQEQLDELRDRLVDKR